MSEVAIRPYRRSPQAAEAAKAARAMWREPSPRSGRPALEGSER
jgi:hypothetical protein